MFLRAQDGGSWRLVADVDALWVDADLGWDALFVLSLQGAPRGQVLRVPLFEGTTVADASVLVPASWVTTRRSRSPAAGSGWWTSTVARPGCARSPTTGRRCPRWSCRPSARSSRWCGSATTSWAGRWRPTCHPRTWWVHRDDDMEPRRTALDTTAPVSFEGCEVERVYATSKDGTQVPVTLIHRAGTPKDGTAPALLYGYGGYSISLKPWFQPAWLPWVEQGGVLAVANVRGGGEYGQEWHHAGRLDTKQNCFDDFIACADHLVETRRDQPGPAGDHGRLERRPARGRGPDAAARPSPGRGVRGAGARHAAQRDVAERRVQHHRVRQREGRARVRALLAYSPYHHVHDGTPYPAVLLTAGEFDPRVDAWHAKKMCARLQAATAEGPILLRMESGGHGIGAVARPARRAADRLLHLPLRPARARLRPGAVTHG